MRYSTALSGLLKAAAKAARHSASGKPMFTKFCTAAETWLTGTKAEAPDIGCAFEFDAGGSGLALFEVALDEGC